MDAMPRLNGAIGALEAGRPAFTTFSPPEISTAQALAAAPYDAVVFEMEHAPYDTGLLRDCMQYMLDRQQIVQAGTVAPAVAPYVRIPANGGEITIERRPHEDGSVALSALHGDGGGFRIARDTAPGFEAVTIVAQSRGDRRREDKWLIVAGCIQSK